VESAAVVAGTLDQHVLCGSLCVAGAVCLRRGTGSARTGSRCTRASSAWACRKFPRAAELFLDSISTFTTYELVPYNNFIFYTVLMSVVALDRVSLKEKVRAEFQGLSPAQGSMFA